MAPSKRLVWGKIHLLKINETDRPYGLRRLSKDKNFEAAS